MANPHRGEVALTVGDREYKLSFSVNALCELEDALALPVAKIVNLLNDPENIRLSTVRTIIWASMRDHHEDVSVKDAGTIATEAGIPAVMEKIGAAMQLAFPDAPEAKGKANPPKAKAG